MSLNPSKPLNQRTRSFNLDNPSIPDRQHYKDSSSEIIGLAESLGYQRNHKNRFDESQEGELQFTAHGMFNTNLGSRDF